MALYTIGDLHLSQTADKSMDVFEGWENYTQRIKENWNALVAPEDTVVLAGDISWGMNMEEAMADFLLIDALPGQKIILKGNHDYWWASVTSMHRAFEEHGITTIDFLHNNSYSIDGMAICGSRGWLFEDEEPHDAKIIRRERIRIDNSLNSVSENTAEKVLFLHYPPVFGDQVQEPFIEVMQKHGVKRCYYGHIHGPGHQYAVTERRYGIEFHMVSADYLNFTPLLVSPK